MNGTSGRASYDAIYLDSFGVEHISKGIEKFIGKKRCRKVIKCKHIKDYIIQELTMCWYFCIDLIGFMLKGKNLLDYAIFFSRNDYEKNEKIILKYFQ